MTRQEFITSATLTAVGALVSSLDSLAASPAFSARKLKVAIIGCGSVSTQYLPHLKAAAHVELVSVCDIIYKRAIQRAEEYQVPHHYDHIDKQLAGAPFDLLVNLTDMQEHGRLNRIALNKGKHVWSEKPMANTYKEGKALLELSRSRNLKLWGAPAVVNSPQFAFMSKAIQEGRLGKVSSAHAHYGHEGPGWSAFFYEKGGGSLPDLGVYNLATLTGLLGPAKSVMAMTNILTPERRVDNKGLIKVEAEDNAMVLMEHQGGVLSHVQCGFNYFDPYGHGGKGQDRHTISIWGTRGNMGLVGYDWAPFGVDLATVEEPTPKRYVPDTNGYVWQEGATVVTNALLANTETRVNPEHALHVLDIIEAARASSKTGQKLSLESTFPWPIT